MKVQPEIYFVETKDRAGADTLKAYPIPALCPGRQ